MASILERNKNLKVNKKTREEHAEDALYREVWEEVNNEKTLRFVKKYSRHLIIAAIVLLIIATGIQIAIHTYNENKIANAMNYEAAIESVDVNALATIGNSGRGATADLALFQSYMLDHDVNKLAQLAEHGNTRDFRDLARLHYVGVHGDDMTGADVEKYLGDLNTTKSPFYYTGLLTIAQKYLAEGNTDAARKYLDKITGDANAPATISATASTLR